MALKYNLAYLSIFCFGIASSKNLPSFIKACHRNEPNMSGCLINLVNSIRPQLAKGIPEMRVPPIDPFLIPSLTLEQGTGSVNFKANFRNIKIVGAKDFILNDIKYDFKGPNITVDMLLPAIKITSDYEINGKILVLPIKGIGKNTGSFTNISANVIMAGKYNTRNGKQYMQITGNKISLKFGSLKINFSNLFNGNKQLSDSTNAFINENWRDIIEEITPLIEETVDTILVGIVKDILDLYSVDEIFPPN